MSALQELFRAHGPAYLARYGDRMPGHQKKVLRALMACRSPSNGSTCYHCEACGEPHVAAPLLRQPPLSGLPAAQGL